LTAENRPKQTYGLSIYKSATVTMLLGNQKSGTGKPHERETQIW